MDRVDGSTASIEQDRAEAMPSVLDDEPLASRAAVWIACVARGEIADDDAAMCHVRGLKGDLDLLEAFWIETEPIGHGVELTLLLRSDDAVLEDVEEELLVHHLAALEMQNDPRIRLCLPVRSTFPANRQMCGLAIIRFSLLADRRTCGFAD